MSGLPLCKVILTHDVDWSPQGCARAGKNRLKDVNSEYFGNAELMKVVMINDCAFVGETLIKYLPREIEVTHLKRSRRFLDKTFGIAWRILKVKGDIYHVHYLLQDCYLALKSGKHPLIGHAHGSDLREVIKSRKWGWVVKHNLKNCDKILVAQPTILDLAQEFNESSEYFPIPYDPRVFYPTPLPTEREVKRVFLAAAHDFRTKGTDRFLYALSLIKIPLEIKTIRYGKDMKRAEKLAKKLGLKTIFIEKVPHNEMNNLYWESDVVLGSFGIGQLDTVAIEAMACGRPLVHHVRERFYLSCPLEEFSEVKHVIDVIERLLTSRKEAMKRVQKQLKYVEANHSGAILAQKLAMIYEKVTG